MTAFQPGDRVHLKGHPHTPHTTGTVRAVTPGWPILVRWDDNHAITEQVPHYLEPLGEPMTTPPLDLPAERLTELRDIANAATEGDWVEYNPCDGGSHISIANKVAWRSVQSATPFADDEVIPHWADARHIAAFDPPTVLALLDRVEEADGLLARLSASGGRNIDLLTRAEAAERACQTLGRVIDRQCEDALTATDSQDLLWGNDGDGDWGAIWERVLGLGEKAREATARAEAAERDLAAVTVSRDGWQTRAETAEKKVAAVEAVLAEHWDWKAGRSLHAALRDALDGGA